MLDFSLFLLYAALSLGPVVWTWTYASVAWSGPRGRYNLGQCGRKPLLHLRDDFVHFPVLSTVMRRKETGLAAGSGITAAR